MICLFISFLNIHLSKGQDNLVELSGIIKNSFNEILPGSYIKSQSNKGTFSDSKGMFNLVTVRSDTVSVVCPGYKMSSFCIPDTLKSMFYYVDIDMIPDTIVIDAITLFPWKTFQEFKQAFLAYRPPQDKEIDNSIKNIALMQTQILLSSEPDPIINFNYVMQQQIDKATNLGLVPSYNIFNPFAWAAFIKALQDGTFKNSRDLPDLPK